MLVYLIREKEITSLRLPTIIQGNYWLSYKDNNGKDVNVISVESNNNEWFLKSNIDAQIEINGIYQEKVVLQNYGIYTIKVENNEKMFVYSMPSCDKSFAKYEIMNANEITIGKSSNNSICYNCNLLSDVHAKIVKNSNGWVIHSIDERFGVYINKKKVIQQVLIPGDTIFMIGLKIVFMGDFFAINNPNNLVRLNGTVFLFKKLVNYNLNDIKEDLNVNLYTDNDYFEKSPRFITQFERRKIVIDPPPEKQEESDTPLLYTIGPMMTMGMVSMVTGVTAINGLISGDKEIGDVLPSLIISFAMIMTMVFWPILSARFQKKAAKKKEQKRQEKYKKYLIDRSNEIQILMNQEKQVLIENNVSLEKCYNIISTRKRNLWEKEIPQKDFLTFRLGTGSIKPNLEISYPEEHFSLVDDNLKNLLNETINKKEFIDEVPVKLSLTEKNIAAIVGERTITDKFLESVLLQLMTFHSYRDLKIVFLSSSEHHNFSYLKMSPHLFSDDMKIRFYAETSDETKTLSNYLMQIFNNRKYVEENKVSEYDYKSYSSYYVLIVDDLNIVKNASVIKEILDSKVNYGFSVLFRSNKLSSLPNECSTFITISGENGKTSGVFENELVSDKQQPFVADLNIQNRVNMIECIAMMSKIPLRLNDSSKKLPKVLSFLEMYDVGKVEQLNTLYRWGENNPTITLNAPVGFDENGELFKLDLHEKAHGPHGLVAGMTGSGKSEFIITYILSLAVNYHPNEVSFVLIDYKGGGLAGAFENRETGVYLPHLAGTITNLDTVEMNRALASIRSELRRRQTVFNEARDKLGESTIDIYKYQKLYRDGIVEQPVSHLFIISDEFAELKTQQPEFMKELISTARIGRSLGVHLILATQKPSGVVDDQIWSNSKFRVCLKVQDKADSKDMIGVPDAASLVGVGRFYLQVGYNEFFALGQSAWCGAPYYPQEKRKKKIDTSLNIIDNIGVVIKSVNVDNALTTVKPEGEELTNIVKYLIEIAKNQNIKIDKLWLNKIPEIIFINNLREKYSYKPVRNIINPVIGEFDDPNNQRQGLLTLPLTEDGNVIIYGTSGSGKEDLLSTLIYSTIIDHGADEVNFYILDFGSEILRIFNDAPQVGDVVSSADEEKIINLFKMLNSVIETRKKLLAKYNGDFNLYNEKNETPIPTIIVVINNYEAFSESYESINEELLALSRECFKYGIILILTATSANSVRYKLSQNFKQLIPLQLNDKLDYSTIVGKTNGIYPSDIVGRGLIKLDSVYEFQTAVVKESDVQTEYIKEECQKLKQNSRFKARSIPVLPEKVTLELLLPHMKDNMIPIGIQHDDLGVVTYNFKNSYASIISSIDLDIFSGFINPLIQELAQNNKVVVIDTNNLVKSIPSIQYINSNFVNIITNLNQLILRQHKIYADNNYDLNSLKDENPLICIVSGLGNLYNRLDSDTKKLFEQMMTSGLDTKLVTFIFIDTSDQFKLFEYNDWYKTSVTKNGGIWIGNGMAEQLVIKTSKIPKNAKEEIPNNFGYIVNKGIAKYVKLVEGDENG